MVTLYGGITYNEDKRPMTGVNERTPSPIAQNLAQNDRLKAEMRTCMPCTVVSFNASQQTIVARPLIREKVLNKATGQTSWVNIPDLPDVPVCFPQGGGFVITTPIVAGDEVMVVFTDMCMDSWWARGGVQTWNDRRRHDLSDAVAIVGVNSKPNKIDDIALDAIELRTKETENGVKVQVKAESILLDMDGKKIEIDGDKLKLTHGSTSIELDGTDVKITGTLKINGATYTLHTHTGVTPGPAPTGPVTP